MIEPSMKEYGKMAQKEKSTQKRRAPKVAGGVHGGGGKMNRPMTDLEKILMGRPLPKRLRPTMNGRQR
jgi:hypothetical protein